MTTTPIPGRIEQPHLAPYRLVTPPKEFFRQFANLAHNRVLNEDFPHEKLLTLKYKGSTPNFVANAKGSLNIQTGFGTTEQTVDGKKVSITEKKDSYITSSEVKFLTAFNNTTTEARFNKKGICKFWTNWGAYNLGEAVEVVSVLKGDTQFNNTKAWVGGYLSRGPIGFAARLQVRREKGFQFNLAKKLTFSKNDLWGGAYCDFNLTDLKLDQYNAVFGYNINKKIHFYLEHTTVKPVARPASKPKTTEIITATVEKTTVTQLPDGGVKETTTTVAEQKIEASILKKIGFGKATLSGVYKDDQFFALAQLGWNEQVETDQLTVDAGVVYTVNRDASVRAKINQDLNLALGGRYKFNKNISLNLGLSAPLKALDKWYDSTKTVPIPFGSSLEFNF